MLNPPIEILQISFSLQLGPLTLPEKFKLLLTGNSYDLTPFHSQKHLQIVNKLHITFTHILHPKLVILRIQFYVNYKYRYFFNIQLPSVTTLHNKEKLQCHYDIIMDIDEHLDVPHILQCL